MRVMLDTNVIISAILKQGSNPEIVLMDVCEKHDLILCDQIIMECFEVAGRRFPLKTQVLDKLFAEMRYELVSAPTMGKIEMRDVKDQPILYAAIENSIDVLVTGDRHFLELQITSLHICSPFEYKEKYIIK